MRKLIHLTLLALGLAAAGCGGSTTSTAEDSAASSTAARWRQTLTGTDAPPALFRGLQMGISIEKAKATSGLKVVESDDVSILFHLEPQEQIEGNVFCLFADGKLSSCDITFHSPKDPEKLGEVYEFLKERYLGYYDITTSNEANLMSWTGLQDKGLASLTLQWMEMNEEVIVHFEGE